MPEPLDSAKRNTLRLHGLALAAINEACERQEGAEDYQAHDTLRDEIAEMSDDDLFQVLRLALRSLETEAA